MDGGVLAAPVTQVMMPGRPSAAAAAVVMAVVDRHVAVRRPHPAHLRSHSITFQGSFWFNSRHFHRNSLGAPSIHFAIFSHSSQL